MSYAADERDRARERDLTALLRERIARRGGTISFAELMEQALYHPSLGYYSTLRGFGAEGDFVTSPELHPVFGLLLARQVADAWEALGKPGQFRVLELGAGSGALATALLDGLAGEYPACAEAVRYVVHEVSVSLRTLQMARLAGRNVTWEDDAPVDVCIANEVVDALPVARVTVRAGALVELRVAWLDDGFQWTEAPAPAAICHYFNRLGLLPPEGAVTEVNLGLGRWVADLARRIPRGAVFLLDYGHTAEHLYGRQQGTLLTYYQHSLGSDPLIRVGRQDISAHVDFTTLASLASKAGFSVAGLTSQRQLLQNLGLDALRTALPGNADQRALAALTDANGLGRIGVLALTRELPGYVPVGLSRAGRDRPVPAALPRLAPEPPPADFLDLWREAFAGEDEAPSG
ncbi:MAG: SAM-dependent methyltransferase [Chloroflexi bacterium]|nr:SAM-dependent methyltransferase [Chloroflexota bacterium]